MNSSGLPALMVPPPAGLFDVLDVDPFADTPASARRQLHRNAYSANDLASLARDPEPEPGLDLQFLGSLPRIPEASGTRLRPLLGTVNVAWLHIPPQTQAASLAPRHLLHRLLHRRFRHTLAQFSAYLGRAHACVIKVGWTWACMPALHCAALLMQAHIAQAQQEAGRHPLLLHMSCTVCNPLADWACTDAVLLQASRHAHPGMPCRELTQRPQQGVSAVAGGTQAPDQSR